MPKFRAVGKSVEAPKEGGVGTGISTQVEFYQIETGGMPTLLEVRAIKAANKADLKAKVKAILQVMKDRWLHAKNTADIVGQVIDEVNTNGS